MRNGSRLASLEKRAAPEEHLPGVVLVYDPEDMASRDKMLDVVRAADPRASVIWLPDNRRGDRDH